MALHEVQLKGYSVRPGNLSLGTFDSYGIEQLHVALDDTWSGLAVTATFNPPEGEPVEIRVPENGLVNVPAEATANAGTGTIVYCGVANGVQRITKTQGYNVITHGNVGTTVPFNPSESLATQVLQAALNAEKNSAEANTAAQASAESASKAAAESAAAKPYAESAKASAEAARNSENQAQQSSAEANTAKNAAQSAQAGAESSATAAAKSAKDAHGYMQTASGAATAAAQSASAAAQDAGNAAASASAAASSKQAAAASATAAQEAAQQTATDKEAAEQSATRAESAAKTAVDAVAKVINEGVAEKLTEMQGIQEDVKARQQDVTEKQEDVTANVELARQAALSNGYMQMGVDPDTGHLMYTRTTNLKDKIDFAIVNDTNLEVQIHG